MKETIIEEFVEKVTIGKTKHADRFYEIFSARGFLLEQETSSDIVRLSKESHPDDCEFLEALQNINYKKIYKKPHFDTIEDYTSKDPARYHHTFYDNIDTQFFDIDNIKYLHELFTHVIPIDEFRLNWDRDWYGKFNQFKEVVHLPEIRVYDLEPLIARFTKAISSIGISTWSSCEGHWGTPSYVIFDRKYHCIWFQTLLNKFIKKNLNLVCKWKWLDNRCTISSPEKNIMEMYTEIHEVARLIYNYRDSLVRIKQHVTSLLTKEHKKMNKKNLLNAFEIFFDTAITENKSITLTG